MKKSIAISVLLIVILSVSVFGATLELTEARTYGSDGITGYVDGVDIFVIDVLARITDTVGDTTTYPAVEPASVTVNDYPFSDCTGIADGWYRCTYMLDEYDWSAGHTTHTMQLKLKYMNQESAAVPATVTIDRYGPEIVSFSVVGDPVVKAYENITMHLKAGDPAYTLGVYNGVGITEVKLYKDGLSDLVLTKNIANLSELDEELKWEAAPQDHGNHTLCVTLKDAIHEEDRTVHRCVDVSVDAQGPVIDTGSLRIMSGDNDIQYLNREVSGKIRVNITEESGITADTVSADLEGINVNNPREYINKPATRCQKIPLTNTYECEWDGLFIALSDSSTATIRVRAADALGNVESAELTRQIQFESGSPQVDFLGSTYKDSDGVSYIKGTDNVLEMKLHGAESGFLQSLAYLDLRYVSGPSFLNVQADNCTPGWTCRWYDVATSASDGATVTIYGDVTSDAGSRIASSVQADLVVDTKDPEITDIKILSIVGDYDPVLFYKPGDVLQIEMKILDATPISAVANLSNLITGADALPGSCGPDGAGKWKCLWTTQRGIDSDLGAGNVDIEFIVRDIVENEIVNISTVEVLAPDGDGIDEPDCWRLEISEQTPPVVDRKTAPLTPGGVDVYSVVDYVPHQQGCQPLHTELIECYYNETYIDDVILSTVSNASIIVSTLRRTDLAVNQIDITCALGVVSRFKHNFNGKLTTEQVDNVSFVIPLYNSPLGEFSSQVNAEIAASKSTISKYGKVASLNKIFNQLSRLCSVLSNVVSLLVDLNTVINALSGTANAMAGTGVLSGVAVKLDGLRKKLQYGHSGTQKTTKGVWKLVGNVCGFVNCQESSWHIAGSWTDNVIKTLDNYKTSGIGGLDEFMPLEQAGGAGADQTLGLGSAVGGSLAGANIKDNIYLSVASVCIPGILYNIDKYRQIECAYVNCLETGIPQGLTMEFCQAARQAGVCNFYTGPVFEIIGSHWIGQMVGGLFSGIENAASIVLDLGCDPKIQIPFGGIGASICRMNALQGAIRSFAGGVGDIGKDWSGVDMCSALEDG